MTRPDATKLAAIAVAHPNIALSKYWGKRSFGHNLPAVPSLSVTLAGMSTKTSVRFDPELTEDVLVLNGAVTAAALTARATNLLDRIRKEAGLSLKARVESSNDFPTASGLASSASAFAALAVAATHAAGLPVVAERVSDLARKTSVSAARSAFGGFAKLRAGAEGDVDLSAEIVAPKDFWDVAIVVAVTREGPKDVGSTDGMKHTADTSPYFGAWVERAPEIFAKIEAAVLAKDLSKLGPPVEQSALAMHAAALAADPATVYFTGATVEAIRAVRAMRDGGLEGYLTIDAGPHVKVLTRGCDVDAVSRTMLAVPGVLRTIVARPGDGARVVEA